VLSGITTWGYVRLRVAQFLANLWQGACMAVYGRASAPTSGSPDRKRLEPLVPGLDRPRVSACGRPRISVRGQHGEPELLAAMN
jgi:hypothetical protein